MPETGLVDVVRDFFEVHQLMRTLFTRYRAGELRFSEIGALVSTDEESVLFRLKEHCHALFRPGEPTARVVRHREALFDLAVGSLYHEAMKFRENFYQREIYGPRVRALRDEAGAEAKGLFQEFERMLAVGTERLEEGLHECDALLDQSRDQLYVVLSLHRENGSVARYLVEHPERVEAVFGKPLHRLLEEIHGDVVEGLALAGHSYLASGYYDAAGRAFADALARGGEPEVCEPLHAYALGMNAYLARDYTGTVERLTRWLDAGAPGGSALRSMAHAAVSRIGQLALGADRERVSREAASLAERLASPG